MNLADPFTREDVLNDLRLTNKFYFQVWDRFGPFNWNIMVSSVNVKTDTSGMKLKFFSRYVSKECDRVNIFEQNIHVLDKAYCFQSFELGIGVTNPLVAKRKKSLGDTDSAIYQCFLVEYPETRGKSLNVCSKGRNSNAFIRTKKSGIQIMETFAVDMLAARVGFA